MTVRARLLVPITYGFAVRYLVPTGALAELARVCQPVVALGWDDDVLRSELTEAGVEVVRLPDADLSHDYRMHRRRMSILHECRLHSPTTAMQHRRRLALIPSPRDRALTRARRWRDSLVLSLPGPAHGVESRDVAQVEKGTNVDAFGRLLTATEVDAVLSVTPYHDQDGLLLFAARRSGLPTIASVISFDNPTTRERMLVTPDRVFVWNRYNAQELLRSYPELTADRVEIIGAPQFDLHRRPELVMDRARWADALDLPPNRPVVLYGAGPAHIAPGERELVRALDEGISSARIGGDPFLLVRRHPTDDPARWSEVAASLRNGRVVDPWPIGSSGFKGWPSHQDIVVQMSSLAHASVHVNVCSSMTLDGAMFDRPQVGPTFAPGLGHAERRRIAELYRQEHWLPIAASGGLVTVEDERALIAAINDGLERPEQRRTGRARMLEEVVTHVDGRSSERLAKGIGQLLGDES